MDCGQFCLPYCVGICCRECSWLGVLRMLHSEGLVMGCTGGCLSYSRTHRGGRYRQSADRGTTDWRYWPPLHAREYDGHPPMQPITSPSLRSIRRTPSQLHSLQQNPTQHDMLPQHLVYKNELNREYVITLARNDEIPWWWSEKIETCWSGFKCFKVF